jgi:MYXO-CTERM domain-containing protein
MYLARFTRKFVVAAGYCILMCGSTLATINPASASPSQLRTSNPLAIDLIDSTSPEPGAALLLGTLMVTAATLLRRRAKKAAKAETKTSAPLAAVSSTTKG